MIHKVGDRVKCIWIGRELAGHMPTGKFAIVSSVDNRTVKVRFEDEEIEKAYRSQDFRWSYFYWEPALILFDTSKPVTLRDGRSVTVHTVKGDSVRPYRATVEGMELSYNVSGQFYGGLECPIDLVNA